MPTHEVPMPAESTSRVAVGAGPIEAALAALETALGPAPAAETPLVVDATARPASGWERHRFAHRAAALGWKVVGWVLTDEAVDALAAAQLGAAVFRGDAPEADGPIDLPGFEALAAALADAG